MKNVNKIGYYKHFIINIWMMWTTFKISLIFLFSTEKAANKNSSFISGINNLIAYINKEKHSAREYYTNKLIEQIRKLMPELEFEIEGKEQKKSNTSEQKIVIPSEIARAKIEKQEDITFLLVSNCKKRLKPEGILLALENINCEDLATVLRLTYSDKKRIIECLKDRKVSPHIILKLLSLTKDTTSNEEIRSLLQYNFPKSSDSSDDKLNHLKNELSQLQSIYHSELENSNNELSYSINDDEYYNSESELSNSADSEYEDSERELGYSADSEYEDSESENDNSIDLEYNLSEIEKYILEVKNEISSAEIETKVLEIERSLDSFKKEIKTNSEESKESINKFIQLIKIFKNENEDKIGNKVLEYDEIKILAKIGFTLTNLLTSEAYQFADTINAGMLINIFQNQEKDIYKNSEEILELSNYISIEELTKRFLLKNEESKIMIQHYNGLMKIFDKRTLKKHLKEKFLNGNTIEVTQKNAGAEEKKESNDEDDNLALFLLDILKTSNLELSVKRNIELLQEFLQYNKNIEPEIEDTILKIAINRILEELLTSNIRNEKIEEKIEKAFSPLFEKIYKRKNIIQKISKLFIESLDEYTDSSINVTEKEIVKSILLKKAFQAQKIDGTYITEKQLALFPKLSSNQDSINYAYTAHFLTLDESIKTLAENQEINLSILFATIKKLQKCIKGKELITIKELLEQYKTLEKRYPDIYPTITNPITKASYLLDAGYKKEEIVSYMKDLNFDKINNTSIPNMNESKILESAKILKEAGLNAKILHKAGATIQQLKEIGFSAKELTKHFTVEQLVEKEHFDIEQQIDRANLFSVKEMKREGFTAQELYKEGKVTIQQLKDAGFKYAELKENFKPALLVGNNTSKPILELGILRQIGLKARDLVNTGINIQQLKSSGFTAEELKKEGFTARELLGEDSKNKIYSIKQLIDAGFTLKDLEETGRNEYERIVKVSELKTHGYSLLDLKNAGFTIAELFIKEESEANYKHQRNFTIPELGEHFSYLEIIEGTKNTKYPITLETLANYFHGYREEELRKIIKELIEKDNYNFEKIIEDTKQIPHPITKEKLKEIMSEEVIESKEFTIVELLNDFNIDISKIKKVYSVDELKTSGIKAYKLINWSASIDENLNYLKQYYSFKELTENGCYTITNLVEHEIAKEQGKEATQKNIFLKKLIDEGVNVKKLLDATKSKSIISKLNMFGTKEFIFSIDTLLKNGITLKQLHDSGSERVTIKKLIEHIFNNESSKKEIKKQILTIDSQIKEAIIENNEDFFKKLNLSIDQKRQLILSIDNLSENIVTNTDYLKNLHLENEEKKDLLIELALKSKNLKKEIANPNYLLLKSLELSFYQQTQLLNKLYLQDREHKGKYKDNQGMILAKKLFIQAIYEHEGKSLDKGLDNIKQYLTTCKNQTFTEEFLKQIIKEEFGTKSETEKKLLAKNLKKIDFDVSKLLIKGVSKEILAQTYTLDEVNKAIAKNINKHTKRSLQELSDLYTISLRTGKLVNRFTRWG